MTNIDNKLYSYSNELPNHAVKLVQLVGLMVLPYREVVEFLGKMNSFSIADNTTSRFSYEWIPYNAIVRKTGLCMIFLYKMTGDNNTLSVSFKTFSGKTSLVWALRGNHGNVWRMGMMTYHPDEEIAVG